MNYSKNQKGKKQNRKFFKNRPSNSKRNNRKKLNTDLFVSKAETPETLPEEPQRIISELPINRSIIENLSRKGYQSATEIQDRTIEPILEGNDLLGIAKTGTGKTGAFLIPLIHNLIDRKPSFQVLVISPVRELAVQIQQEYKSISYGLNIYSECLIGGTDVRNDVRKLKRPCHTVIGTPGRIADMVRQKALNPGNFSVLVLDEFDRLLDMGFAPEILALVEEMRNRSQTILFSATEDKTQKKLIEKLLNNPVEVRLNNKNTSPASIDQEIIRVSEGEKKMEILVEMIRKPDFEKVLVFADTRRGVNRICTDLRRAGIKADEIHGNKSQNYRLHALDAFKKKKIQVLVATDVAARGLDIDNVSHVINYQPPQNHENYIHRIGRTGRAGKKGKAFTFVN